MEEIDRRFIEQNTNHKLEFLFKDGGMFTQDLTNFPIQENENVYQQKYPKIKDSKVILDYFDSLHYFVHHSSDEVFYDNVATYFDIENIIDWHIL